MGEQRQAEIREMIGGPWHKESFACDVESLSMSMPLPAKWRADPLVPQWAVYRRDFDSKARCNVMVFVGLTAHVADLLLDKPMRRV